jgi:hypothetical protein
LASPPVVQKTFENSQEIPEMNTGETGQGEDGPWRWPLSRPYLWLGCGAIVNILFFVVSGSELCAQSAPPILVFGTLAPPGSGPAPVDLSQFPDGSDGRQTKRILGILPNFEAVSANTNLPPLSPKQKFWLSTEGAFDYSSFISVAMQAAIEQATNTYPEFHHGAAAYGRYYWHAFADAGVEDYLVGAILPAITHEDPRYYTLYRGGFFHRAGYALSRLCIARKDSGGTTFNFSEILGSGVAAEVSGRYYPRQERSAGETVERWSSQLLNDGIGNVVEEFWPDINHRFFHRR